MKAQYVQEVSAPCNPIGQERIREGLEKRGLAEGKEESRLASP